MMPGPLASLTKIPYCAVMDANIECWDHNESFASAPNLTVRPWFRQGRWKSFSPRFHFAARRRESLSLLSLSS